MRKTILVVLACVLVLAMVLSACQSGTTTTAPPSSSPTTASSEYPIPFNPNAQTGGTMIINHNGNIASLGAPSDATIYQRALRPVFEPLLICDANENLAPWLATSWSVSDDGKAVTLKLRQGIKFSDDTDFNAEAVKFNFEDYRDKQGANAPVLFKITSFDIPDPYTITIHLSAPDVTFLLGIAQSNYGLMASPTAVQKPTTPDNIAQLHMVGTGPFLFDSWQRDNYIQYKANPNYWQKGKPYLSALRWNFIPDQTASILAFRSGQANVMFTLDPVDAINLKNDGFNVGEVSLKYIHCLIPDGNNPDSPFAKLEVRQALEYALNKNELVAVGSGYFYVATQHAKPTDPYYDPTIIPRDYDLAEAKRLLASAGYPEGVPIIVVTSQSMRVDTENLILSQIKAAGFNVTQVAIQPSAAYWGTLMKGWKSTTPGVGSLLMAGFPDGDNLTMTLTRFSSAMFPDEYWPAGSKDAWKAAAGILDDDQRNAAIRSLIHEIFDTAALIPYQYDASRYVNDSQAQGWGEYFNTNNSPDFYQPAELWLKTK
jgi:ABC-type transport system substrate-binding protein